MASDLVLKQEVFFLRTSPNVVDHHFRLKVGEISDLHQKTIMGLAAPDEEHSYDFPNADKAWGRLIRLTRQIDDLKREIHLLYLRAEGVTLSRNLFNTRSIAPRMLCFKQCQDGFGGQNWTTFLRWDGPLGRAVWENRSRPEFIVSAYDPPQYNWPWSRVWQHHKWDSGYDMTHLASYALPGGALSPSARTPLRYDGVSHDNAARRTIVRLQRPRDLGARIANGVSLDRERFQTLEMALCQLTKTCAREGTQNIHAIGCHFEDEAPALYAWKWKTSQPKTLTIHCESEGDLACYGPAADEVLD